VEFRVLGTLEATVDGVPSELKGTKQRQLLAAFLVNPNTVVSVDRLSDILWGDDPPQNAAGTLHTYVSRLRSALETPGKGSGGTTLLVTRPPGYVLQIDPDSVDAVRFEGLMNQAQRHRDDGKPKRALQCLDDALALWRGDAFAEFANEEFARTEALRLEELRRVAVEERIDVHLELGHHAEVVGQLENAIVDDPLRERPRGQLMVALYRCGRQAQALRVYQDYRHTLADQLGIDPSPALSDIERAILDHSPELDWQRARPRPSTPPPSTPAPSTPAPSTAPLRAGSPPRAGSLSHPSMGPPTPSSIGRQYERTRLEARLDEARSGQPRVVLVTGEAGIGKTALVRDLSAAAARLRYRVLTARCMDGLALPYMPLGGSVFPELRSHLARWSRETPAFEALERFMASWPSAPPPDTAEADGLHLMVLLCDALLRLAVEGPVVVVVDDLHWCDRPTADLLLQVALRANDRASLEPLHLLVVTTFRESELGSIETNVARLRREPSCSTIELRGLDRVETGLVLERAGVDPIPPDLLTRVHHLSRGNPLYIEALARSLKGDGVSSEGGADLPFEIRGVVDAVVARLDPSGQEVLRTAAVLGDAFSPMQLEAVLDLPVTVVDRALDAAVQHGLLRWIDGDTVEFAHPLCGEALRRALSARQRRSMHAQIAEALARAPKRASVAVVASHLVGAGSEADAATAMPILANAARQAAVLFAWDEAARFLEAALALRGDAPVDAEYVELEHQLGIARMYSGNATAALEHLRVAREGAELLGSTVERARVLVDELHSGAIARRTGLDPNAECEDLFVNLEASDPELACNGLSELAQYRWTAFDYDDGERLAHRALDMARRHDAHGAVESAQRSLAVIDWRHGRIESSRGRLLDGRAHARASGDRKFEIGSACRLPLTMIWCGDVNGARAAVDEAVPIVRETNYLAEEGIVLLARAYLDVVEGSLDAALDHLVGIFLLERITSYTWASVLARALMARVRTLRGEWHEARLAIEDWDATSVHSERQRSAKALETLVLAGEGRSDAVSSLLDRQAIDVDSSWRAIADDSAAATLVEAAYLSEARAPLAEAMSLMRSLEEDGQLFTTTFLQLIPRVIGEGLLLEGRLREAEEQLHRAAVVASKVGAQAELAMCWHSLARVHLEADEWSEAERCLKEAAQLSQTHGLHLARRVNALAGSAGLSLGSVALVDDERDASEDVVVMFVDVVDSTRLTYEYGDTQYRAVSARLDRQLRQTVDRHGGSPIEATNVGDGLLAELSSPVQALACAIECLDVATTLGLELHIGLNVGSVVRDRSNIFGTTVNVAARVTAQTAPNEVLVTEPLVQRSGQPLRHFTDRGIHELKGLPDPIRLFAYAP
jgi:DNA-binding SARP family transcriptional activator/class 3 adenylate cyclase